MVWYNILLQFFLVKNKKLNKFWEELTAYFPFITYRVFDTTWATKKTLQPTRFMLLHADSLAWDHVY
jgi:hypothetical protein